MEVSVGGSVQRLPDFLLVGAAKAGTTTLYRRLASHPKVFLPENKEPYFFSFDDELESVQHQDLRRRIVRNLDDYCALFAPARADALLGDASTSYLYTHDLTVAKVRRLYEGGPAYPKIVGVLRNPVDRAYSHYTYLLQTGVEWLSFEEAIAPATIARRARLRHWDFDYLGYGRYHDRVAHYLHAFPGAVFLLFEDLVAGGRGLSRVYDYLGIDEASFGPPAERANPSGIPVNRSLTKLLTGDVRVKRWIGHLVPPRHRPAVRRLRDRLVRRVVRRVPMNPKTRITLNEFFREDVERLAELLQRDLSDWLAVPT